MKAKHSAEVEKLSKRAPLETIHEARNKQTVEQLEADLLQIKQNNQREKLRMKAKHSKEIQNIRAQSDSKAVPVDQKAETDKIE